MSSLFITHFQLSTRGEIAVSRGKTHFRGMLRKNQKKLFDVNRPVIFGLVRHHTGSFPPQKPETIEERRIHESYQAKTPLDAVKITSLSFERKPSIPEEVFQRY